MASFTSPLAEALAPELLERFLRYVRVDTQSQRDRTQSPSTPGQLDLSRMLVEELKEAGLEDAELDDNGYVMATLPSTVNGDAPAIGLIAHVDTSPDESGAGVEPIVHRGYDGAVLELPRNGAVLDPAVLKELAGKEGHDIVTASGDTLLGADDKAGVAEIMTAVAHLAAHPELPRPTLRIAFTPDEEIGRGTEHFDVARFGAAYAYTVDGGGRGEIESESFSADALTVTFQGINTHPGFATGRMVNAIKVAAAFIASLPGDGLSPETTAGYDGFVHPYLLNASVDRTAVKLIVRDFVTAGLKDKEGLLTRLAQEAAARYSGATVEVVVAEQYRNMREILDRHPIVVEHARDAIRLAGLEPRSRPIRGGTDGSRLSFMGLPTPNLFAGEHNFHSRYEWVSVQDMEKTVDVIVNLAMVWERSQLSTLNSQRST
jgi:tripeptide aminopeptidase